MASFLSLILIYFIDYAITVVLFFLPFLPFYPLPLLPPAFPHLTSCPWVIHISSWASPFPILFLTFPSIFCTIYASYSLYLFPHSLPFTSQLITLYAIFRSMILFLFFCLLSLPFCFVLLVCFQIQLLIVVNLLPF